MTEMVLELKELAVGYDAEAVAQGLSLQVSEGEIVAIVGASGVGKSTARMDTQQQMEASLFASLQQS